MSSARTTPDEVPDVLTPERRRRLEAHLPESRPRIVHNYVLRHPRLLVAATCLLLAAWQMHVHAGQSLVWRILGWTCAAGGVAFLAAHAVQRRRERAAAVPDSEIRAASRLQRRGREDPPSDRS